MRTGSRTPGPSSDVYGRWTRAAVWHAVAVPAPAGALAVAATIREHLQRAADASASAACFEVREADEGFRVSGRDAAGTGVDVIVRYSGELTVTPHEDGRPVPALVEDFRREPGADGLEYRAAPWRRHGNWLRFEAQIALRPELA